MPFMVTMSRSSLSRRGLTSCWLLPALAVLCATVGHAVERGPLHNAPVRDAAGSVWPACTCPMPMPEQQPAPSQPVAKVSSVRLPAGEVEVLTVDVRVANKVRCENASIAEDVAKILNIPVQRITVTPWSWTLPGTPQSNYLAFVQEDHERCDCKDSAGGLAQGQGFRKAINQAGEDGWMLGPDTSVMTVSQFKAVKDAASFHASPSTGAADSPAPSRVQLLTRDPCLVELLREQTPLFRKKIASLLGVPEDKVIVDPPPVKGTVGLMQLDATKSHEGREVPVLAMHHCNLADLGALKDELSFDVSPSPTSISANSLVPANASTPAIYAVAAPNGTTTRSAAARVSLVMKLHNINYDALAASMPLVSAFTSASKASIAESGHVTQDAVKIALYPGSVVVEATITAPGDTSPEAVLAFLNGTVCDTTVHQLSLSSSLSAALTGALGCNVLSLKLEEPSSQPEEAEANRAWIAFWSITVLPPFAQDGAWRLLNLINKPMSELSKLLPLTLGRIPGLKYRGLADPNAAIKDVSETRLPPPLDKAVGFQLPDPMSEKASFDAERRKMTEQSAVALSAKNKAASEQKHAQDALADAQRTAEVIKESSATFSKAAGAHARAMRPATALRGPDIKPHGIQ